MPITPIIAKLLMDVTLLKSGCWEGVYKITKNGTGKGIKKGGARYRSTKLVWEFYNGPLPFGHVIIHTCNKLWCRNPSHLKIKPIPSKLQSKAGTCKPTAPP